MTQSAPDLMQWPRHSDPALAQMGFVDVSHNPRINAFMAMAPAISTATEPKQVLDAFSHAVRDTLGRVALITISRRGLEGDSYRVTRHVDLDGINHIGTDDPWNHPELLPVGEGGFIGKVIASPQPKLAHGLDIADEPLFGDALKPYGSMIAIPAFTDGKATHWALQFRAAPDGFTEQDLADAIMRINLISATVNSVLVARQLRQMNERMQEDVHRIARIQRALLPQQLPTITGLDIAASYETYDTAGGDLYDFVSFTGPGRRGQVDPDGRWGILIGDVSGHGPAAAVVMAMLNSILYAYPKVPKSPAEMLDYANRHLMAKRIDDTFVTAFLAFYNPKTRKLTYARAGHPPPLLKAAKPKKTPPRALDKVGDVPLGVLGDVNYQHAELTLQHGQTLVLYTDGITDAAGSERRMFGIEGIVGALADCGGSPECVIDSVTQVLRRHEAGVRPNDDQTILALQVK